jgi:hypothetical protein
LLECLLGHVWQFANSRCRAHALLMRMHESGDVHLQCCMGRGVGGGGLVFWVA